MSSEAAYEGPPALICWYSEGFRREDGLALLEPLLTSAKASGITEHLVLDHPNEYGLAHADSFGDYLALLLEKIEAFAPRKPLLLFGHSRGSLPAAAVASRLGERVLALYVVAPQGAIVPGEPTPWEKLRERFQATGERSLLAFFAEMQPGNLLLQKALKGEAPQRSSLIAELLALMRRQYVDCPLPGADEISRFPADIVAVAAAEDKSCPPELLEGFQGLTSGAFRALVVKGGHMGCLRPETEGGECELHRELLADMKGRWKSPAVESWRARVKGLQQELVFGRLVVKEGPGVGDVGRALQRALDWLERNAWAAEGAVAAQRKTLQRYLEEPL